MKEWSDTNKWNPFNSYKLLAQAYRWSQIKQGSDIPQPALLTIDPINACDLKCQWCNANYILRSNNSMLSQKALMEIADFLPIWQGSSTWPGGVDTVCIAGGGEPLLHPHIGQFIDKLSSRGIGIGVITNGTNINKLISPLSKATWVGVSVDAGTPQTFKKLKKVDAFHKIINNIQQLTEHIKNCDCKLGNQHLGSGVSYKFLLTPNNIDDIIPAANIAKDIGCTSFHLRPAGIPWDQLSINPKNGLFNNGEKSRLVTIFNEIRSLEDESFGIYGITHKFDNNLNPANRFKDCYAIFMSCVIMPPRDDDEIFRLGLCCDRRGDQALEIAINNSPEEIRSFWGSTKHWEMFDTIELSTCPRCTYQPHNQIMEHVILQDNMTFKFI